MRKFITVICVGRRMVSKKRLYRFKRLTLDELAEYNINASHVPPKPKHFITVPYDFYKSHSDGK